MRRMKRHQVALRGCAMVKYHSDNRYSESSVASHDRFVLCNRLLPPPINFLSALIFDRQTFPAIPTESLLPLVDNLSHEKYCVIGIDEGQFVR